jgi:hypothetical protein
MSGTGPRPTEIAVAVAVDGDCSDRGPRTELRLVWREDDPLAVSLSLTTRPDHPSLPRGQWVVLRDFLRYGLDTATGDGDVKIQPLPAGQRVRLELAHPGRPATVTVPVQVVAAFLDETERRVPSGEERSDAAVDALIERLLAND